MSTSLAATPNAGAGPALVMTVAVCALALPSAVLGFSTRFDLPANDSSANRILPASSGQLDPRLARAMAARPSGEASLFRFTPAGLATRPDRSVTVAVRVDDKTASTIIVRGAPRAAAFAPANVTPLRIVPTVYNLGLARGYAGFAANTNTSVLPRDNRHADMPDLANFGKADQSAGVMGPDDSRLAPRIAIDERDRAGRAPRTLEGTGEASVDLGGSYRITRNLDVTAGVRYSRDRDRLKPVAEGKSDSQSVFVGTQFRF